MLRNSKRRVRHFVDIFVDVTQVGRLQVRLTANGSELVFGSLSLSRISRNNNTTFYFISETRLRKKKVVEYLNYR